GVVGSILSMILILVVGFAAIGGLMASLNNAPEQADRMVLELDLRDGYNDQSAKGGLEALLGAGDGFIDVLLKLEAAIDDERVMSVFVRAPEFGLGSSRAEEIRQRFLALKEVGKPVIVHSQGSYGGGPSAYRAISAADEIWVQPGSDLIAPGIAFETLFLKDLFDNLSINPQFEAFHEYKNAPNTYLEADFTPAHREAMTVLATSLWDTSLADIASDRDMSIAEVDRLLRSSPIGSAGLIDAGLADSESWPEDALNYAIYKGFLTSGFDDLSFADFVEAIISEDEEDNAELTFLVQPLSQYTPLPATPAKRGDPLPKIAIVGGQGPIITGGNESGLLSEAPGFASDAIARALLSAADQEDVKAIVFRVDSPGGSPTASDQIWRAIEVIQSDYDIPVVVSMGSVAASGGYYVSTGADWIVANRSTITGSIGIFGGKFAVSEGLARIGVNARSIKVGGSFTGAFTTTEGFNQEQRAMMRAWLERGYDRFIGLVAEGRKMSIEETDAVARGRVWSGVDAVDAGLVDQLGTLNDAIKKAAELAGIEDDVVYAVDEYPKAVPGFPFGGPMAQASIQATAQDLQAIGEITDLINTPQVQVLLNEVRAAETNRLQARMIGVQEQ
ncbi:MAG: signal peptide peptidase SppA, partial [Pseudomonadota bacterium]